MFRFKENARLMPCLEDVGLGSGQTHSKEETNKSTITYFEGICLIVEYQELQEKINVLKEEINVLKEEISGLENKQSEISNKLNTNPILMNVLKEAISEMTEENNISKTK